MSTGGILVALILLAIVALWVTRPLFGRVTITKTESLLRERQRSRLLVFYERVLTNIRDLEEDHATGKIATGDYESERESQTQRGIQVLKTLDRLDGMISEAVEVAPASSDNLLDQALEATIEEAVAAFRNQIED